MAKVIGSMSLHTLKGRLNVNNRCHREFRDGIEQALLQQKRERLQRMSRSGNLRHAMEKAKLKKTIKAKGGKV